MQFFFYYIINSILLIAFVILIFLFIILIRVTVARMKVETLSKTGWLFIFTILLFCLGLTMLGFFLY